MINGLMEGQSTFHTKTEAQSPESQFILRVTRAHFKFAYRTTNPQLFQLLCLPALTRLPLAISAIDACSNLYNGRNSQTYKRARI